MAEQAQSAERRATESAKAHEALRRDAPTAGRGDIAPVLAGPRDDAALRSAIAALADEVLRSAGPS